MALSQHAAWVEQSGQLLNSNRVEVGSHRYTRPAPSTYEHQWLWDSCFHAIIYRWFDGDMARDELLSLVSRQVADGPDAGMIPHMIYWDGAGSELWGVPDRSIITQPPLIAVAARLVYEKTRDADLLRGVYEAACAYHEWFRRRRDPDGDHLVSLIHPWESGWDSSTRWDSVMGLSADPTDEEARAARMVLVKQLIAHDCNAHELAQAGFFHVEAADFNAIRAADLESLSVIAGILGKYGDSQRWLDEARHVQNAIRTRMLHDGRLYDLSGLDEQRIDEPNAGEFSALFGGCFIDSADALPLIKRLESYETWTPYPVPTTPADHPLFRPDRYWRGNVWLNVNWLIWFGLRRYGFHETAQALAEKSAALVELSGFHEYFNPLTGQGHGSFPHSWSAIVLDMIASA